MKEELGMYQNQLTTAITLWTVGYALGQSELALLQGILPAQTDI